MSDSSGEQQQNKSHKAAYWALGISVTIILALVGNWGMNTRSDIKDNTKRTEDLTKGIAESKDELSKRVSKVKTEIAGMRGTVTNVEKTTGRIESEFKDMKKELKEFKAEFDIFAKLVLERLPVPKKKKQ